MCSIFGYSGKTIPEKELREAFLETTSRGPDDMRFIPLEKGFMGFQRLAIMGLTPEGMQPFALGGDRLVCNGEIYGFRPVKKELERKGYVFAGDSDCEILLPLYREYGVGMFEKLDAEFATGTYRRRRHIFTTASTPYVST